jgi:prophage antirepressor-like protein|nr:MAG TPA: repressor domain protein [Caudoviricetes sp.]
MNELKIFENEEFGSLRTMEIDGKIYFVAKDVAGILGYSNPRKAISDHVDEEDKGVTKCDTLGGNQNLTIINESGLYSLVLYSKMPNAKKFKHWITADVLPSIRQYGAYLTPDTLEKAILNPDFIIQLATSLKEYQEENKNLKRENQTMLPKAEFYDEICDRNLLTNFRDTAKELKVKEKEFIKWLEDNKYIYRDNRNNIKPYSQYCVEPKRFFDIKDYKTDKFTGQQTFVTILGKNEFRIKLIEEDKNNE